MKRVCTICARGGSKGVPNKNIRELNGKPLIAYSIQQAQAVRLFDVIAVSSDSDLILQTAKTWGAELLIKRPENLASDTAPKIPAIQHCVLETEKLSGKTFDTICDLDPTSPFRIVGDIHHCVQLLESRGVANVITGAPARKSPYFNLVEIDSSGVARLSKQWEKKVVRRQDSPKCFDMNASIYVWQRGALMNSDSVFLEDTLFYEMPRERSIEIDTEFDFEVAAHFARKGCL
ncbi:MAG: flagellar modification protein B [Omnitrophica bacterium RIFOXYB12_FULL_50_7]|nr:MAG: flagellar modification protein B [Omnitrophica bacterium RIFOXYB12_FULL_50_7]